MRICHIHASMQGGGIESMVCALANEMSITQDVTVCSIYEPKESDIFWNRLSNRVSKATLHKRKRLTLSDLIMVMKFVRNGHFDVVNLHGFFYYYVIAILLLHSSVKFFYTVHSDANRENQVLDKYLVWFKRFCFHRKWMHPITISDASESSFISLYHCSGNVIYNGIPIPHIIKRDYSPVFNARLSSDTIVFFHAGRIDNVKNQYMLCSCIKNLIDNGYDVSLVIAGKRQYEETYGRIEPFFSERIIYIGEQDNIPQLMSEADAMCLSSIYEGMPVTLLEALATGCVPICTPVGGVVNVLKDGINGFVSNSINETDYYDALLKFIHLSSDDRKLISEQAKQSFYDFTIEKTVQNYISLYESI